MSKLAQKRKISVSTVSRMIKKMVGKNQMFQQTPVECSNGSEASGEEPSSIEWPEDPWKSNPQFFHWGNFHHRFCLQKQNDQVVACGNDVSEPRRVSTANNPASIIMFGVVASNGENMPLVWFGRSYRLTSAVYKKVLETKVVPWVKKVTKKWDYVFQQDRVPAYTAKSVQNWLDTNMSFWPPQSPDVIIFDFSLMTHIEERVCKTRSSNTDELKTSVNRAWRMMQKLPASIRASY